MRAGMVGYPVSPISIGSYAIPSIPGSPSVSSWLSVSPVIHPRVDFAVDASSRTDWQARSFDRPCHRFEEPGSNPTRLRQERGKAGRKPVSGKRWQQGIGLAGTMEQATLGPVAASAAAAGG
jgi:hypothetical protein